MECIHRRSAAGETDTLALRRLALSSADLPSCGQSSERARERAPAIDSLYAHMCHCAYRQPPTYLFIEAYQLHYVVESMYRAGCIRMTKLFRTLIAHLRLRPRPCGLHSPRIKLFSTAPLLEVWPKRSPCQLSTAGVLVCRYASNVMTSSYP